jgi:hypothetical protein
MEDIMVYTIQKSMFSQRKAIILFALLLRDRISKVWNDRFIWKNVTSSRICTLKNEGTPLAIQISFPTILQTKHNN